jgi:NAD(P)-dependent dehydrogenase (short-subunit alcohol dehydrogenase family)
MKRRRNMNQRFTGKVALVSGGGSGIGRAVALALAWEGATVVVAGRHSDTLEQTAALIGEKGGKAQAVVADVSSSADVGRLVGTVVAAHGGLHISVNSAGNIEAGPVADLEEEAWTRQIAVNLTGVFLTMKHVIAHMRANGGGAIVNVSSIIGAHKRLPYLGAYAASKAAVSALTRTAALECIGQSVRINAVSPGPVDTPMSLLPGETEAGRAQRLKEQLPIGRIGSVEEVAGAILWLVSPESAFVVGHDFVIDGGAAA